MLIKSACLFTLLLASVASADIYRGDDVAAQTTPAASIVAPTPDAADTVKSADSNNAPPNINNGPTKAADNFVIMPPIQVLPENYKPIDIKLKNKKLAEMIGQLIAEELEDIQPKADGTPGSSQVDNNKKYSEIMGTLFSQLLQIPVAVLHAVSDAIAHMTASAASVAAAASKPINTDD